MDLPRLFYWGITGPNAYPTKNSKHAPKQTLQQTEQPSQNSQEWREVNSLDKGKVIKFLKKKKKNSSLGNSCVINVPADWLTTEKRPGIEKIDWFDRGYVLVLGWCSGSTWSFWGVSVSLLTRVLECIEKDRKSSWHVFFQIISIGGSSIPCSNYSRMLKGTRTIPKRYLLKDIRSMQK